MGLASTIKKYRDNRYTVKNIEGGMVTTIDDKANQLSPFGGFLEPDSASQVSSYNNLASEVILDINSDIVRESMAKSSPDVSKALRDFIKYCNPGWVLEPESHPVFDQMFDTMHDLDGGFDSFLGACFRDFFLHGGCFTESVYNDGRLQRIVALNPNSAIFRLETDERGNYYALYQRQGNDPVRLEDDPTIEYTPIFKSSTNPRGVNFVDPAVYHLTLSVDFFKAYKATIEKIAWPKVLIHVDRRLLKDLGYADAKIDQYVKQTVEKLKKDLKELKPGQVLTYGSEIVFQGIDSAMNAESLGHTPELTKIVAKQIVRGLGTNQLFLGLSDSVTETRARWEVTDYSKVIAPCQNALAAMLTRQFNLALREAGSSEVASFRFLRSIFEEVRTNAEIFQIAQQAFGAHDASMTSLLAWLQQAVDAGRMTEPDAQAYFDRELEQRRLPELRAGLQ